MYNNNTNKNRHPMDLKTLTTFVTVARLKNFTAAARELHTVQPTVSRHISDLENELQTKLFDRTTHQVDLTPSGERLLPEAYTSSKMINE